MYQQPTLFDVSESRKRRDEGMNRAIENADRKIPSWSDNTFGWFKKWLQDWPVGYRFQMEDFRMYQYIMGFPNPPSNRAYGQISVRARKEGLIKSVGTKKVTNVNAHRCFSTLWEKI